MRFVFVCYVVVSKYLPGKVHVSYEALNFCAGVSLLKMEQANLPGDVTYSTKLYTFF
jgi:hypothetical protein